MDSQVIRLGRQMLLLAVSGTVSLALYLHFFGGGSVAVLLFVADAVLWLAAIACGLVGPMLTYRSAVQSQAENEVLDRQASLLMIAGIGFSLLPGPWAFVVTKIMGSSQYVISPIVMVPAILFLTIGFGLILYRVFVAMIILSRSVKQQRSSKK